MRRPFLFSLRAPVLMTLRQLKQTPSQPLRWPVLNVRIKDWPYDRVLPDVRIERFDQLKNPFVLTQPVIKRAFVTHASKVFAFIKASSSFVASLPPPRALSGLPPPLPPTMGAMVWMILPA